MELKRHFEQPSESERLEGNTRILFGYESRLLPSERTLFPAGAADSFVQTATPCPVTIYHFPRKTVITKATERAFIRPDNTSSIIPAFSKAGLPLNSWVPGAGFRVPILGRINFGYINPGDGEAFQDWLDSIEPQLSDAINSILSSERAGTHDFVPRSTSTIRETKTRQAQPLTCKVKETRRVLFI